MTLTDPHTHTLVPLVTVQLSTRAMQMIVLSLHSTQSTIPEPIAAALGSGLHLPHTKRIPPKELIPYSFESCQSLGMIGIHSSVQQPPSVGPLQAPSAWSAAWVPISKEA